MLKLTAVLCTLVHHYLGAFARHFDVFQFQINAGNVQLVALSTFSLCLTRRRQFTNRQIISIQTRDCAKFSTKFPSPRAIPLIAKIQTHKEARVNGVTSQF